jgi:hypothetical protein
VIINGTRMELPNPKEPQVGTLAPHNGYETRAISADGKYIVGKHRTFRGNYVECGWKYNENTGKYDLRVFGEDWIDGGDEWGNGSPNPEWVSPDGKYTAGMFYAPMGAIDPVTVCPYYRDTETGVMTKLTQFGGSGALFLTNDGLMGIAGQLGATQIIDINNIDAEQESVSSWATAYYGITPDFYIGYGLCRMINEDKSAFAIAIATGSQGGMYDSQVIAVR